MARQATADAADRAAAAAVTSQRRREHDEALDLDNYLFLLVTSLSKASG
ncbi:hypothetical protein [Nonomuraea wenchangensis]